jgi:hypothetical protein
VIATPPVVVDDLPPVAPPAEAPPPPLALIGLSGTASPPLQAAKPETRAKTKPDRVRRRIRAFYSFMPIEANVSNARTDICPAVIFRLQQDGGLQLTFVH